LEQSIPLIQQKLRKKITNTYTNIHMNEKR
jgi:hypothetical protein